MSQQSKTPKSASVDTETDLLTRLTNHPPKQNPIPPKCVLKFLLLITERLLRKYIGYAKKYCPSPVISDEARSILQEFYLSLRENQSTSDYTPITTRQIESMVRLAEARARLELRDQVTKQDAEDVVQIVRQSLKEAFEDDFECFDFRKTSGMSSKKQQQAFVALLNQR